MSMAAVALLIAILVALDPRVRQGVNDLLKNGKLSSDVARMNSEAHGMAAIVMASAREQSLNNASLAVFVAVATGLVVAMLRL